MKAIVDAIITAWSSWPPPRSPVAEPKDLEAQDIEDWLIGKDFMELASDEQVQAQMPLLFLNPSGCAYYLATYLILAMRSALETPEAVHSADFPTIHLTFFLVHNESFGKCWAKLSPAQKAATRSVAEVLVANHSRNIPISSEDKVALEQMLVNRSIQPFG